MKKAILFILLAVFFMVEYEGYDWDPCSGNVCLSIYCGPSGICHVDGETRLLLTQEEVKALIDQRGIKHLKGIYEVSWPDSDPTKVLVRKLKLVPSFELK